MIEQINGWWWPVADQVGRRAALNQLPILHAVMGLVPLRRVVVQAGGNCGVWPLELSHHFETVYTFEPDNVNFVCLTLNTESAHNVIRLQSALGCHGEPPIRLGGAEDNCAGYQVAGPGQVPVIAIDDLNLPALDLLYLDIEGYETRALLGAERTITRHRPVIAVENKGMGEQYGNDKLQLEANLLSCGYAVRGRLDRDTVFVPKERMPVKWPELAALQAFGSSAALFGPYDGEYPRPRTDCPEVSC